MSTMVMGVLPASAFSKAAGVMARVGAAASSVSTGSAARRLGMRRMIQGD